MSRNQSFVRKVIYIAAIALLLMPLSALSRPATTGPKDRPELSSPGGKLSQLRSEYRLAQADLGEIDPASETMKLATLGMRGVAVNILWGYADHYKKVKDWDKVELTVQQIIRLQPNFLKVWDFQAHNLSYNVSVEFDDYRMRYKWVKEGINFLITGTHYNEGEPGLLSQVGWFTGQKIGRSDEKKSFRRMFREDRDFHQLFRDNSVEVDNAIGADGRTPDCWLVSGLWYDRAADYAAAGKPIRGMSELLFYGRSPMSLINGAAAMQDDGYFGQRAQIAWRQASDAWTDYGNREVPNSRGYNLRLNDYEAVQESIKAKYAEIDKLAPALREDLKKEKIAKLPEEVQAAFNKPAAVRTPIEKSVIAGNYYQTLVSPYEIRERAPADVAPQIRRLASSIEEDEGLLSAINGDRQVVGFEYWRTRCDAENMKQAPLAHEEIYLADRLGIQGEKLNEARERYERGFKLWGEIYKKYPGLMINAESKELITSISRYRDLLGQLDEPFPTDFELTELLKQHYEGEQLLERIQLFQRGSDNPTEEKPAENKPTESKPESEPATTEKPAQQPAAEQPVAEQPADAKTESAKPADEQPSSEEKPDAGNPKEGQPDEAAKEKADAPTEPAAQETSSVGPKDEP